MRIYLSGHQLEAESVVGACHGEVRPVESPTNRVVRWRRSAPLSDVLTVPTTIILMGRVEQKRLCGLRSSRALRRAIDRIQAQQPVQIQRRPAIWTATAG